MADPVFRRLAVIGLGLIGSSVLRACRERPGLAGTVVATDNDPAVLARVAELGIADVVEPECARAVHDADCVMLCAPVGAFPALAAAIAPHLAPGCVVTDTGSTKQSVIRDLSAALPANVHLVPAHPMAGTEFSGPDAGFETLFDGRYCLLTPLPGADPDAVGRVSALWRGMGATIETMEPGHHDRVVAIVSHLPGFLWYAVRSSWQARRSPGFQGMQLLADRRLTFWTATAWDDLPSMQAYRSAGTHRAAMRYLAAWCDEASVARWVDPAGSLGDWHAAHARMLAKGDASPVRRPSPAQLARAWPPPRTRLPLAMTVRPGRV